MNAAARVIAQGSIFQGQYRNTIITKPMILMVMLFAGVIFSSIALIYLKSMERHYVSEMQTVRIKTIEHQQNYRQLLLERSTLTAPIQLEAQASHVLHMSAPRTKIHY